MCAHTHIESNIVQLEIYCLLSTRLWTSCTYHKAKVKKWALWIDWWFYCLFWLIRSYVFCFTMHRTISTRSEYRTLNKNGVMRITHYSHAPQLFMIRAGVNGTEVKKMKIHKIILFIFDSDVCEVCSMDRTIYSVFIVSHFSCIQYTHLLLVCIYRCRSM